MLPVFSFSRATIVDCGASRTALGIFGLSDGRLRLENWAVERFPAPTSGEDAWLRQTSAAFAALRSRVVPVGRVILVLPPHLTLTKLIRTPRVSAAKRDKIVRFEAAQGIPYNLAEVTWDTAVAHEGAADLELLLAAAKLEAVNSLVAAAEAAGFGPAAILPAALATLAGYRLGRTDPQASALVLNLGARSTVLLQVEAKRFATRTLPIGGASVTLQLATNQDCEPAEAEALKLSAGGASLLADALDSFATRLAQEITRSVLHFARQGGMGKPDRILLTGGTARLAGLDEALAARLKLPVEQLDTLSAVEIGARAARAEVAAFALELTDLVGAAVIELNPPQPALNLLPPALRRRAGLRRRRPWLMAAVGLAAAALVPPILHFHQLADTARAKTAAIEATLVPVREREARNRSALEELAQLRRDAAQLESIQQRRTGWLGLLADFQQRLVKVEDVWFEKLQTIPPSGDAPLKLVVSGRMLDKTNPLAKVSPETIGRVRTLLAGLAESPFIKAVEGERFDNNQPGILRFDFVLVTDPAHPL